MSEEAWVDVPSGARFALAGLSPNPASGRVSVSYSVADRAPLVLELVDVTGRRIARREIDRPEPGHATVELAPAGSVTPGLYFVRMTQGTRASMARGAVVK